MSITGDARSALVAALTPAVAPWPVSPVPPLELAVPCVYVDVAERRADLDDGAPVVVVTFPVVAVVDGADEAQVLALDLAGDRIWDAAVAEGAEPAGARAEPLDVGGPRLRALTTLVDVIVARPTLCAPEETQP